MTTFQFWGPTALPCFLVLVGILINQVGLSRVIASLNRMEDKLGGRIDKLDSKVDEVKDLIHSEVKDLLNMIGDHGQRLVRLERKPE